jgi:hypothetical protein
MVRSECNVRASCLSSPTIMGCANVALRVDPHPSFPHHHKRRLKRRMLKPRPTYEGLHCAPQCLRSPDVRCRFLLRVRGFQSPSFFYATQYAQKLRRGDLRNGRVSDLRKDVPFQSPDDSVAMTCDPTRGVLREPVPTNHLKAASPRSALAAFAAFRCAPESTPSATCLRASSLRSLTVFRLTSGYVPSDSNFSLPPKEYLDRHHLPRLELISRNKPRSPKSLRCLACGLAFLIAVSVSGMWGNYSVSLGVTP